ncbi:hypothetical protein CEXT_273741 [Caerostris extrusa]|uniref:Uncharacterized protein n=1 Tax=Caerostris extrusa TaxID=172846 RepID=A0AAV4M6P2_CAEEX|nr:hypothetical protein CEXT_273741 [Caerostris extrusa]
MYANTYNCTFSQSPHNHFGDHALNLPNVTEPTRQTRFDFHLNKSSVCDISSLDRWLLKSETHLEVRSRGFDSPPHTLIQDSPWREALSNPSWKKPWALNAGIVNRQ